MRIDLKKYAANLKITTQGDQVVIYDIIRKKDIILLPEELIRQCVIHFLLDQIKVSKNLMKVEKGIEVNKLSRRCDILVYDRNGKPILLVECKRPETKINQKVFNQIAMYNLPLKVPFLMVTNGDKNYFCRINFETHDFDFLEELPRFEKMVEITQVTK